jgi:hypothetical protein
MTFAAINGERQPREDIKMPAGQAVAGAAIGILVLDLWYPLLPGNVANASTFEFPVQYHVMRGTTIPMIHAADPALLGHIVDGARKLVRQGARAIVGACGYFANYQPEAAEALPVPTFLSSLLQVPLILQSLAPQQRVGIICASESALTDRTLAACGIHERSRIAVTGAQDIDEFRGILDCTGEFNSWRLERELVALAHDFIERHPDIGVVLLECSDMPPYARAIQNAIRKPVFDFITMIDWIQRAVVRKAFHGFI